MGSKNELRYKEEGNCVEIVKKNCYLTSMAKVNNKDIPQKKNSLGQYFTPSNIVDFCLRNTVFNPIVIEPSCGEGAFVDKIDGIIALEVDEEVAKKCNKPVKIINFYDFDERFKDAITFIGNPPFRCPAFSLTNKRHIVKGLMEKYNITGMREEAVFFIVKTVDLILRNNVKGDIYYILPKSIFHNNSKSFTSFTRFLKKYTKLVSVIDIPSEFENVNTDLCYVHLAVNDGTCEYFSYNGLDRSVEEFYGVNEDLITFHRIFKKTYLGSVPCESVLMSVRGEPVDHFQNRLYNLFSGQTKYLIEGLSYNGEVHLMALRKGNNDKLKVVGGYVDEIRSLVPLEDFLDKGKYKSIQHRREKRWYFRHDILKKASFLYQLNPNPCLSFYFPSNPVKGCLDYHGYCEFDVNRNCSPSANRCVPLEGDNLTDEFKEYWTRNTDKPYYYVFDYISHILNSNWYKEMKNKYQRFYFGVPQIFDVTWRVNESLFSRDGN